VTPRRAAGQAMVEFALIAPLLMILFVGLADAARGFLAYNELAMASRAGARQAVLELNSGSNTSAPSCYPSSCSVPGVMPAITRLAGIGFPVNPYGTTASPPSYCSVTTNAFTSGSTNPPLSLDLTGATPNRVYACIYEFNPVDGTVYWAPTGGGLARQGGHQMAVVFLQMNWQPVILSLLQLGPTLKFSSQTVQRIEF